MARNLTKKQKGFVKDYLETGNGTQSVLKNYDTKDTATAAVMATENLSKPNVREYLESKAEKAAEMIFILSQTADNEGVKLGASKDILDRSGFKPVEKSINLNVDVEITDPKARELAMKYEEELKKGL